MCLRVFPTAGAFYFRCYNSMCNFCVFVIIIIALLLNFPCLCFSYDSSVYVRSSVKSLYAILGSHVKVVVVVWPLIIQISPLCQATPTHVNLQYLKTQPTKFNNIFGTSSRNIYLSSDTLILEIQSVVFV